MSQALALHAFVISWTGREAAAAMIAEALQPAVERLTVVYSRATGEDLHGAGDWQRVPDDWFYGRKFEACLGGFEGEVMLQVQADALCEDWPRLAARCRNAFARVPNLGVWAPRIEHMPLTPELASQSPPFTTIMRYDGSELESVSHTDGVVWACRASVAARLRRLDYKVNNYGWGIEKAAICHAMSHAGLVLQDAGLRVGHRTGRGYPQHEAARQLRDFSRQLTPAERVQYQLLGEHVALRWQVEQLRRQSQAASTPPTPDMPA